MTNLFEVDWKDALNAGVSGVGVAVLAYFSSLANITTLDPKALFSVAVIAFVTSILKKFLSDDEGKLGGVL